MKVRVYLKLSKRCFEGASSVSDPNEAKSLAARLRAAPRSYRALMLCFLAGECILEKGMERQGKDGLFFKTLKVGINFISQFNANPLEAV